MNYLFDTNTCIAFIKKNKSVLKHIRTKNNSGYYISSITEAELWFGVMKSKRLKENSELLENFLSRFSKLPLESEDARWFGEMKAELRAQGKIVGDNDIFIASQAYRNDLILITDNEKDFNRFRDLRIQNWLR